jgi:proteic killer suppression protein
MLWRFRYRDMIVEYRDKNLALVETDRAAETRLPIAVINSMRQKLVVIRAAPDDRTLRNWKSLHYEKMEADERSIRLNDKYRLIFTISTENDTTKMTVLRVWDHD